MKQSSTPEFSVRASIALFLGLPHQKSSRPMISTISSGNLSPTRWSNRSAEQSVPQRLLSVTASWWPAEMAICLAPASPQSWWTAYLLSVAIRWILGWFPLLLSTLPPIKLGIRSACYIDGARVDFDDGFSLARACNTSPRWYCALKPIPRWVWRSSKAVTENRFLCYFPIWHCSS